MAQARGVELGIATPTRPLRILSANFFSPDRVPSSLQDLLPWNPVLHVVQWFRSGFRADEDTSVRDLECLACWVVASFPTGMCMMRIARPRLA